MELALHHRPQGATWNKGGPPPQIRDYPLFAVVEPFIYNLLSNQCRSSIRLVVAAGGIIKIPYLRWWSSFIYNCQHALWQEHTRLEVGLAILVHRHHMTQEALISTIVQSSAELSPAKRCLSGKINENFFPSDLTFIRIRPAKLLFIRISPAYRCFNWQWNASFNQRFQKRTGTFERNASST